MTRLLSIVVVLVALCTLPPACAQFSPRDFFAIAPASTFYTEDEMSEADKTAIIKGGFRATTSFSCTAWGVAEEDSQSLTLKYCKDSFVRIRVYPSQEHSPVVLVESTRASGRASNTYFYRVSASLKDITPIPEEQLQTIGIEPVTENDLVTEKDKFKDSEAERAILLLSDDGRLRASVDTWMNPRWENKDLAYDVIFEWTDERFQKRIIPLHLR